MIVVGLTGGIGSGKSTVLKMFQQYDVAVYIADIEAKRLMNHSAGIKEKIIDEFGVESYTEEGLNRAYLAAIVFKNKNKLAKINNIVHPEVRKDFEIFLKDQTSSYVIYESAILFENAGDKLCDYTITVIAPLEERLKRIIQRDGVSKTQITDRMKHQLSDEEKIKKSNFIITNTDLNATKKQVKSIHTKILQEILNN